MPLRAVRSTSWAPLICVCVPAWATCRVAASTWCTRSRSSTRSLSASSTASSHGAGVVSAVCASLPGVGQREHAPAGLGGGGLDEPFVLELLQGRVHRAGARRPVAAAALRDHLDDLVAVHRLLGEEGQDRRADVAAAGAPAGAEAGRRSPPGPCSPVHAAPRLAVAAASGPLAGHEPDLEPERLSGGGGGGRLVG